MKNKDLRYPIGQFQWSGSNSEQERTRFIDEIAVTPERVRKAIAGLSADQLETPYRDGGWTVRQVVHHLPDSHMNSYIRIKLSLTENEPTVKTYDESRWAELPDARSSPIEASLKLLEGLHQRWVILLRSLSPEDAQKRLHHPELGVVRIDKYIALYAWHGAHHVAHIAALRERMGW